MKLQWNTGVVISQLSYDPILVTCFEGLTEDAHPYCFIAQAAIKEMLEDQVFIALTFEFTRQSHPSGYQACVAFENRSLESQRQSLWRRAADSQVRDYLSRLLSNTVGSHLNPHLKNLLVPLTKRMDKKDYKEKVFDVLRTIQDNGVTCSNI